MYIKSVVIDGFKSYAQRTEVNGFDPFFNAITGLNGSGKSNILDSICFLLGITNLTQVRATNLQELVYKNGQAGVTKATVCITFDNSDKKQSPFGYEQYEEITVTRQVVIGGRNKYLINGSNANNTRVQDMFRSVQLNVNNPHFLIMQGRITKVLNMKPPEILSMIEEAAGTRLYESKKETAQKTIEKKDAKLKEINAILEEEITPTLTRLKEERSSYLEYQKVIREIEHLNKLYIAYQFVCAEETKQHSAQELQEFQEAIQKLKDQQNENANKIKELDGIISDLEKKRDKEAGGELEKLETAVTEKQKADAKAQSNVNNKKGSLKAEQKKLKDLEKSQKNDKAAGENKKKELEKINSSSEDIEKKCNEDKEKHEQAQKHFQAVSAGLCSNDDGEDASLNDQLMAAQKDISNADTEIKKSQMALKHAEQDVKKKSSDLKKTEQGYKKDQSSHEAVNRNLEKLETEIKKLNYEEGQEEKILQERRKIAQDVQNLREKVDMLEARFPQLAFEYKDPEKNFDRKKVHGLVAKLISVKSPESATALEVAAGGKLYNVVVDDQVTGNKLLKKGELKRRVTIIPLNKISSRPIDSATAKRAESVVGRGNVHTALSLIGYEKEIDNAMKYVFGNTFICNDMNIAKKVTFDPNVMRRTVTLSGDSFDPSGTLTGGARARTDSILVKLSELKTAQDALNNMQVKLDILDKQLHDIKKQAARWRELKQQYELKQQEAQHLEDNLKQSTHGQQLEEISSLQQSIEDHKKTLEDSKEVQKKASGRVKELQDKIKNAKAHREKELKNAEEKVKKAKKDIEASSKKLKDQQQEVEGIRLEIVELEKEMKGCEEQIITTNEAIKAYEEQVTQLEEAANETKEAVKVAQDLLNKQKEVLKATNKDISQKINEQKHLHKEANNAQLKIQELDHNIQKCTKQSHDAVKTVESMLQQYDWIADENKYFGQPNTAYDFTANNPKEAARRLQKLQDTKEKLSKNVNMRAMNMLGKAEEQYNELMKKRKIVLSDKGKIAAVIKDLDKKKNEALMEAHAKVNQDFGSIFSSLLPGTQAKLIAPEGCSILDGLEVKVAFGDVWKESLAELSGGQRSLVALSLILSLLLFKPAPLYILDEVDAALDLSHTQNIGHMLKTHFRHSQFIVVSLKDGMFNNANVLFKTKFVDGVSTVTRYVQNQQQPSRLGSSSSLSKTDKGKGKGKQSKRAKTDASPLADHNEIDA